MSHGERPEGAERSSASTPAIDKPTATRGLVFFEPLLFERSKQGREGWSLPVDFDESKVDAAIPADRRRQSLAELPEVSEPEVVRHYVRLSQHNYCVDVGLFPLGSCTMKYNPKVNEWAARIPGFCHRHPYAPERDLQGAFELMVALEAMLAEIAGLDAVSLQPAAGAQGEFLGLMVMRAFLSDRGDPRKKIIIPDSAHGTNPATCTLNGYATVQLKSGPDGMVDPADVARVMADDVAGIMITNPNTLGVFEKDIHRIAEIVHEKGGQVYMDGANMNALVGVFRPGSAGVDVMHFNLHKTFSIPHGGGGPGSGPIAVRKHLEPYLPSPRVAKRSDGTFGLIDDRPKTVGRVKAWFGNYGCFVRAYTYLREFGADGLRRATEAAILNANYLRAQLKDEYQLATESPMMHEVVLSDGSFREIGVETLDIAKRIMDYGFHPPTMYFPLIVRGSLMIEPTESETKETLDSFVFAMKAIAQEAKTNPTIVRSAPTMPSFGRFDEARAARNPVLRWKKGSSAKEG